METKRLFKPRHRVPLCSLLRLWLLSMLLSLTHTSMSGGTPIGTTGDRAQVSMVKNSIEITDGQQYYEFNLLVLNYDGNNYYWTGDVTLTIDGQEVANLSKICRDNGSAYVIGTNNEDKARAWTGNDGTVGTARATINGLTDVTVELHDPHYERVNNQDSKAIWVKVRVGIERKWYHHNYKLNVKGTWCTINDKKVSRSLEQTLYALGKGTDGMPDDALNESKFTRKSNHTIELKATIPSKTMTVGYTPMTWQSRVQLLKNQPSTGKPYVSPTDRSAHWNSEDWTATSGTMTKTFTVESNYDPVTVYPRLERYLSAEYNNENVKFNPKYDRDYGKVVIGGFPKAVIKSDSIDVWGKKVTLEWGKQSPNPVYKDVDKGRWRIYRQSGDGTIEGLKTVNYDVMQCTLENVPMNVAYNYIVSYVPDGWTSEAQNAPIADLYSTRQNVVLRPFETFVKIDSVAAVPGQPKMNVYWKLSEAIGVDTKLKFSLYHSTDVEKNKNWELVTDNIEASKAKGVHYSYTHDLNTQTNTCAPHFYKVTIDALETSYSDATESGKSSDASGGILAGTLTASKGLFSNVVRLRWEAKQIGASDIKYNIYRRLLGTKSKYSLIATVSGTKSSYAYDDNTATPGDYYEYQVESVNECSKDGETINYSYLNDTDDGFCATSGVISGTITFGSGTAVEGVKVALSRVSDDGGDDRDQYHSASFDYATGDPTKVMSRSSILVPLSDTEGRNLFTGKPWTIQMLIRVDQLSSNGAYLVYSYNNLSLSATQSQGGYHLHMGYPNGATTISSVELSSKKLQYGRFYSVAYSYDGSKTYSLQVVDVVNGEEELTTINQQATVKAHWVHHDNVNISPLVFGDQYYIPNPEAATTTDKHYGWRGNLDDIRVFSGRKLTDAEIMKNYNHLLAGTEKNLAIYMPLDEGLTNQSTAYDMSKTAGVSNGHHGKFIGMTHSSNVVPDEDQLSLFNYTDEQGNYTVSGVPFNGEGISYMVRPTLGVHEFTPPYATRYVSANSLIHSGVNFEDISSFRSSGVVYYKNTTIPVEGVSLYVDGKVAMRNNQIVTTAADGTFEIDVPIGKHYISVAMNGHVFENEGRWPEDVDNKGQMHNFDRDLTGITFYDETTVVVAGRVTGGNIENDKPLGLGKSVANIGKATLTLDITNSGNLNYIPEKVGTLVEYKPNPDTLKYDNVTTNVKSKAYIANVKDQNGNPVHVNQITIKTDPSTGEFAAMLPPLYYRVSSVTLDNFPTANKMPKNWNIPVPVFNNLPVIDATNPLDEYTDSVQLDNGTYVKFNYNASAKIEYKAPTNFSVTENEDGSFGEKTVMVKSSETEEPFDVYSTENEEYTFGYPVYIQHHNYAYYLYGFERYYNFDDVYNSETGWKNNVAPALSDVLFSDVPLANADVTIKNQYASSTGLWVEKSSNGQLNVTDSIIVQSNTFQLDSLGRATYHFVADAPNVVSPYTRKLEVGYNNGVENLSWSHPLNVLNEKTGDYELVDFQAIVLGGKPTGSNFVTEAPDDVLLVLRDPPGSNSSTTYTKDHSFIHERKYVVEPHSYTELLTTNYLGITSKTAAGGGGVWLVSEVENTANLEAGLQVNATFHNDSTWTYTTTTTEEISTSDDPDYVGADGDVFIGSSRNLIFSAVKQLQITDGTEGPELGVVDAINIGQQFTTSFNYSQKFIETKLLPNFEKLRNDLLEKTNHASDEPVYTSILPKTDPNYGSSNDDKDIWGDEAVPYAEDDKLEYVGPSYKVTFPDDYSGQDMVSFYNEQIKGWKKRLADNEKAKVDAFDDRSHHLDKNYSFDAGAAVTYTISKDSLRMRTNTETQEINAIVGGSTGFQANKFGIKVELTETLGITVEEEQTEGTQDTHTFSFTLAESGSDYMTVDVLRDASGNGPIFHTRAGATSCPYEGEVKTKYYQPGLHNLMESTVKVEDPEIVCQTSFINGIPAGGDAVFKMDLRNISEIGEDAYFNLYVDDKSNPNGAAVFMDGFNITNGRRILVQANETLTKTFTLRQTNPDVLDYDNIRICLSSECQDDIVSATTVSVHFVAACSDIVLKANTNVVNSTTTGPLVLSMSGYNTNMNSLTGALLQFKGANDANWTTLQEYVKDPSKVGDGKLLLPALSGARTLDFSFDLASHQYTDQTYEFRAITNCSQGGDEVHSESDWIEVVRDITRPQLLATPTPTNGVLGIGDDISILFNEDIQSSVLRPADNFFVRGALNESQVTHDVALSLTGSSAAKTEAAINLSGKSFAANMWLNYSDDGTLLQHGTTDNNFKVAIKDGKLAITVGGHEHTSSLTLPKNEWIFLALNYDNSGEKPKVNASYAQDAYTYDLMKSVEMPAYNGNGPVAIGGDNLTAKVQELALWNNANSLDEALVSRYTTKSKFTNGLLGYWQFNEGHGSVAADRARQRSMTLPSDNGWFLDGVNYAMTLDGNNVAAADISTINTLASDDYLVEAWFRADAEQAGVASVMSIGNDKLDLRLNASGQLELSTVTGADNTANTAMVSNSDLRDSQWHHVALNVLKSTNGNSTIYLDGKPRTQVKASLTPALQGDKLFLGGHRTQTDNDVTYGQFMKGAIDEVRIWKGRRTADVIASTMYHRVQGDEPGLVAYFPLEHKTLDGANQVVTSGFADNCATAETSKAVSPMRIFNNTSNIYEGAYPFYSSESTPALAVAPQQENVMFNFVASERQITINLLEDPYKMEGCTIYLTAKDVKDLNGNTAADITWSAYVQQNRLKWSCMASGQSETDDEISVVKYGNNDLTFSADIENVSATNESYEVTDLPLWLSVDKQSGNLPSLSKRTLTFTVDPSLAIGTYETKVFLKGSQGIPAPLNITLTVEGDRPNWVANTYSGTMTVIGQLKFVNELSTDPNDMVLSTDPNDMVAAFRGTECVGVAHPKYFARNDAYFVLLTIYGEGDADINYKAYDASTGRVYTSVAVTGVENPYSFAGDKSIGTFGAPALFAPTDEIEQQIAVNAPGWKWFSLYAQPKVNAVGDVFKQAGNHVINIIGHGATAANSSAGWTPSGYAFDASTMYKLKADSIVAVSIIGPAADPASTSITLNPNWSWIGYPAQASNSLLAAFGNAEPQEGDMVKSQTSFAMFSGNVWKGTLKGLTPGEGYMYLSKATAAKTFVYPTHVQSSRMARARMESSVGGNAIATYKDNMTMIAVVKNGDELIENAQVSVYAGTELCALSTEAEADGLHFLTIGGTAGQPDALTFIVSTEDGDYVTTAAATFQANAHYGTLEQPYVLQLGDATGIDFAQGGASIKSILLFDGSGRMVRSTERPSNLYTKKDLKSLPAGVYYQQVTFNNGQTIVQKIMK